MSTLMAAINFAAEKHRDQRRKDCYKTPYINHPIGVAYILMNCAGVTDENILAAAVLHDTLEDTQTTYEELVTNFGKTIADFVVEVTDDKSLPKEQRKMGQINHAPHMSMEASLVKLADKLYNCSDLQANPPHDWSIEQIQGYFVWTYHVIAPIRKRNEYIDTEFTKLFEGTFSNLVISPEKYPVLPEGDLDEHLKSYLNLMATKN